MVRSSGWETGSSGSPLRPRELLTCLLGACCSLRRLRWELRRSRGVWGRGKQLTGFLDWGREAREREDQVERRMRDHNKGKGLGAAPGKALLATGVSRCPAARGTSHPHLWGGTPRGLRSPRGCRGLGGIHLRAVCAAAGW